MLDECTARGRRTEWPWVGGLGGAELTGTGPGAHRAELTVPTAGTREASVSVRTSEVDNPVAVVPFEVGYVAAVPSSGA